MPTEAVEPVAAPPESSPKSATERLNAGDYDREDTADEVENIESDAESAAPAPEDAEKPAEEPAGADPEPDQAEAEAKPAGDKPAPEHAAADPVPSPEPAKDPLDKLADIDRRVAVIREKMKADKFDPIDDATEALKIVMEQNDVLREVLVATRDEVRTQARATEADRAWSDWSKSTGIAVEEGQKMYTEELKRAESRGFKGQSAQDVARDRWQDRVEAAKAGKKPAAPPPMPAQAAKGPAKPPVVPVPRSGDVERKKKEEEGRGLSAIEKLNRGMYF